MSFLFGKKNKGSISSTTKDTPGGPNNSAPNLNGGRDKEKTSVDLKNPTPGSSVNNSVNSVGGGENGTSPEYGVRGGQEQDAQVCQIHFLARFGCFYCWWFG